MRHPFERWLAEQAFSAEARSLFNEALSCYMAKAFRAAFIMSYLAFMTALRDRLLESGAPRGVGEDDWVKRLMRVRTAETWDSAVFDCIQQKAEPVVFPIADDLRQQVRFFKDRRNDSAHGKQNGMGYELVETFWSFIRNNLDRFVVNGSEQAVLEELQQHFNPQLTRPGEPVKPIIERIRTAVDSDAYPEFVRKVFEVLVPRSANDVLRALLRPSNVWIAFDEMISLGIDSLTQAVMDTLIGNNVLDKFLLFHPDRVYLLNGHAQQVRSLWKNREFLATREGSTAYAGMLSHGLIPANQVEESMQAFVYTLSDSLPEEGQRGILEQHGLQRHFERIFLYDSAQGQIGTMHVFRWANGIGSRRLITAYLDVYGLTEAASRGIAETFAVPNHPNRLAITLNTYFNERPDRLKALRSMLEDLDLPFPRYLTVEESLD